MLAGLALRFAQCKCDADVDRGSRPRFGMRTKKQKNKNGDAADFQAAAKYSCAVDGQNHTGQRVEAGRFSKGDEAVQRQRYQALKTARDSGEPIVCRVNPARPSDSVVFSEFIFDSGFVALQVALLAAMAGGLWFACRMISELRFRGGARIPMKQNTESHHRRSHGGCAGFVRVGNAQACD